MTPRRTILVGDAIVRLQELAADSVDCVITSPPYFQLRNYGMEGQLGLEPTVEGWVQNLRRVVQEVARVLKPSGCLWLNLGDSYSRHPKYGASPKSLLLGPERLLLALATDGWIVRNKVIWAKSNPMPHSVTDRLTATYEQMFFLVRSPHYHFFLDEIREPHRTTRHPGAVAPSKYSGERRWAGALSGTNGGLVRARQEGRAGHRLGKNPGDVWTLSTAGYRGAHFATFPEPLVERPLLATCPERICRSCERPWRRDGRTSQQHPVCSCRAPWRAGLVLDPFFGAGTVGVVAQRLGRDWLGIELNPEYVELARERLGFGGKEQAWAA